MINRALFFFATIFLVSCGGFNLVLKEGTSSIKLKGNTNVIFDKNQNERLVGELFSFLGNNEKGDYILVVNYTEEKENILVKKNQVAEKIDYEIIIDYDLFYKDRVCKIYNKKIISQFSFVPKSFGYNFGSDRSLEALYRTTINKNIRSFANSAPSQTNCIK